MSFKKISLRKVTWNFFNHGSRFEFDPAKKTFDIRLNPTTLKDVHLALVRQAKSPAVFILDELGEKVA